MPSSPASPPEPSEKATPHWTDIWRSIFGWRALFRWDTLAAIVPGFFIAIGFAIMAIDWFPHNLVWAQWFFGIAAVLLIAKFVGHAVAHPGPVLNRVVFASLPSIVILIGALGLEVTIQHHKNAPPAKSQPPSSASMVKPADPADEREPSVPLNPHNPGHASASQRPTSKLDQDRHQANHSSSVKGSDNTVYTPMQPTPSIKGSRNTILGATGANGNTLLNRGGTAIGSGATAGPTDVAIGANAQGGTQERPTNYDALGDAIDRVITVEYHLDYGLNQVQQQYGHDQKVAYQAYGPSAPREHPLSQQQEEQNQKLLKQALDKAQVNHEKAVAWETGRVDQEWQEASPSIYKTFIDAQNWLIQQNHLTHNEALAERLEFNAAMTQAGGGADLNRFTRLKDFLGKFRKKIGDYQ